MKNLFKPKNLLIGTLFTGLVLVSAATFASKDGVQMYSSKDYAKTDTVVRFYKAVAGQKDVYQVAHFKNRWYAGAGDTPDFEANNGAWERVTPILTHNNPKDTAAITAVPSPETWNAKSSFTGGKVVQYQGACYQAKWWTQGDMPSATQSMWTSADCPKLTAVTLPAADAVVAGNEQTPATPAAPEKPVSVPKAELNRCSTASTNDGGNIPTWDKAGVYTEGNVVKKVVNTSTKYYKAKWWTQGNDPAAVAAHPWDSPWLDLGDCVPSEAQIKVASNEKPNSLPSDVLPKPAASSDQAADNSKNLISPAVPPVVVSDVPKTTAVVGAVPTVLPADGYAFLRKVTDADWDWLFPMRSGKIVSTEPCSGATFGNCGGATRNMTGSGLKDTFTRDNFIKAVLAYNTWAKANNFKQFLNEGTMKQQAEEFITFWAKSSRETSGSWNGAPAPWIVDIPVGSETITSWKGGLYFVEEIGYTTRADGTSEAVNYVDAGSSYRPEPGRSYYGRGVIQLSWNYNYGAFSQWLFQNKMLPDLITEERTLLKRPDYVATDGRLAFLSGIWFWMTPQGAKPASQDVLLGRVTNISASTQDQGLPRANNGYVPKVASGETSDPEVFAYRLGTVINIVNGGLECNKAATWHNGPVQRVYYYDSYAAYFNHKYQVNATRMPDVKASSKDVWQAHVSASSPLQLQSATCFNQKSYYGW